MKKKTSLLLVFGFVVLAFFACIGQSGEQSVAQSQMEVPDSLFRLRMIFVGDIMGHDGQIKAALNETTGTYDYVDNYEFVAPILKAFDLAFCNLEVTLPGKPPYAGYPNFRSPDALAYALREAGFNIVVTANNHSNDAFGKALVHTIDTLMGLGFYQTGTFRNQAEKDSLYPLVVERNGFRLAILNYTYGTNGIPDTPPTIVNMIDTAAIRKDVLKAHTLSPDLIMALMHWGDEYQLIENRRQKQQAEFLAKLGVNLIIGSHPHVIQPVRWVPDAQGDSALTVYSLGNYISNQTRPNTDGGMMFEISYTKHKESGKVSIDTFYHHLVWRHRALSNSNPGKRFQIIPIAAYEAGYLKNFSMPDTDKVKMEDFASRMRQHLASNSVSKENTNLEFAFNAVPVMRSSVSHYHVQLLALQNQASPDTFARLGLQVEERHESGVYRYITLGFSQKEEADVLLENIRKQGFPDAFIVVYKDGVRQ